MRSAHDGHPCETEIGDSSGQSEALYSFAKLGHFEVANTKNADCGPLRTGIGLARQK